MRRAIGFALIGLLVPIACANVLGFEEGHLMGADGLGAGDAFGNGGSHSWPPGTGGGDPGNAGAAACTPGADGVGCALNPPSYIDVNRCANIVETSSTMATCIACCSPDFGDQSFINQGKCTCADLPLPSDKVVCAAAANMEDCSTCCSKAGIGLAQFSGGCTCLGRTDDAEVCVDAARMAKPDVSCANCCMNHGYLGIQYSGLGVCTCTAS